MDHPLALIPVYSPEEMQAVTSALLALRGQAEASPRRTEAPGADLVARLADCLANPRLPDIYLDLLKRLREGTGDGRLLPMSELSASLGIEQVRTRNLLGKVSARIKRIMTPEETARTRTPLNLLLDIEYAPGGIASHRLTAAGAAAVARMLR